MNFEFSSIFHFFHTEIDVFSKMMIRSHVCARQVFWNWRLGHRGSEQHVDSWLQVGLSSDDNHALMNDFIIEFCFAAKLQPQLNESFYSVTGLKISRRSRARASSSGRSLKFLTIVYSNHYFITNRRTSEFSLQIGELIKYIPFKFKLTQLVDRLVNRTQSKFSQCMIKYLHIFRRDSIKLRFKEIKFEIFIVT